MLEYLSRPRADCFLDEKISTYEEAFLKVERRINDDSHIAVSLNNEECLIGELFYLFQEPDTYSIGWNFNAHYEGNGYASESAEALLRYLFTQKKARRVYAYVDENNDRSQKLCKKLGMRKEGLFIEFISFTKYEDGTLKYENTLQYALLKKEWENNIRFRPGGSLR